MTRCVPIALACVTLLLSASAFGQDAVHAPLRLNEVLRSVEATHPTLEEARQLVLATRGDALASEGAFDPKLTLSGKGQPAGKYTKGQLEAIMTQMTPWWGATFYAGWRRGFGSFAVYDGRLETLSAGEIFTGFNLPLWQGGPIDEMRARMMQADFDVLSANEQRRLVRILLGNAAARAYWTWVEAGQLLGVQEKLLGVADQRMAGISRRIEKGDVAPIIGVDNRRILFERRAKVIASRQKLEAASAKLSLFIRTTGGDPRMVGREDVPTTVRVTKAPSRAAMAHDIRFAQKRRPDVKLLALAMERQKVELEFRDNQLAPRIDLKGWMAKDFGSGKDELRPLDLGVGLSVKIPLLFRKERGKLQSTRAKLAALRQKSRLARDKVAAEVRIAHAALSAAADIAELANQQRIAAERMAVAERRRFALGEADLLQVNLRELSAAKASSEEIRARTDYQRALADYRAAVGRAF